MAIEISAIWNVANRLVLFKQFSEDEAKPRPARYIHKAHGTP